MNGDRELPEQDWRMNAAEDKRRARPFSISIHTLDNQPTQART
ncbi:MAG: hypothetical protein ACR2OA_08150 [Rubripirellula sp.]